MLDRQRRVLAARSGGDPRAGRAPAAGGGRLGRRTVAPRGGRPGRCSGWARPPALVVAIQRRRSAGRGAILGGGFALDGFALGLEAPDPGRVGAGGPALGARRSSGAGKRAGEYYALLLLAACGMLVMAGGRDLLTLWVGPRAAGAGELHPGRLLPRAAARPSRRRSSTSSWARCRRRSCSTASRSSTASPAPCVSTELSAPLAGPRRRQSAGALGWLLLAGGPLLQDRRGAVPRLDSRRLRRCADAGDRLPRRRFEDRLVGAPGARRARIAACRARTGRWWWPRWRC